MRGRGWVLAAALAALLSVVVLVSCGGAAAQARRVHARVSAVGVEVGGLHESEARARLAARLEAVRGGVSLRVDGQEVPLPAGAFGDASEQAERLTRDALRIGREAPLAALTGLPRALGLGVRTQVLPPPAADRAALRAALAALAGGADRPALEPQVLVDRVDPGRLTVVPGVAGRRLDTERTADDLAAAFAAAAAGGESPRPVEATFAPVAPAVTEAQLEGMRARMAAALREPITITVAGAAARPLTLDRPWQHVERLDAAPGGGPGQAAPGAAGVALTPVFGASFDAAVAPLRQAAARPARDARLEVRGEEIAIVPDAPGAGIEPAALRAAAGAALFGQARSVEVAPVPVAARVTAEALAPARARVERAVSEPVVLTRGGRSWTWGPAELRRLLALPAEPDGEAGLDEGKLRAQLEAVAKESDRPATNPRLEVREGQIVTVPGKEGEGIDVPAAAELVRGALRAAGAARAVALPVRPLAPEVGDAKLEAALAQAQRIVSGPLAARHGARSWAIAQAELPAMLRFGESGNGIVPYLSRDELVARLAPVAEELDAQLEREHAAALAAWEKRQEERAAAAAAAAAAREAEAGEGTAAAAPAAPAETPVRAQPERPDPQPRRQWVDVPATAAALWVQAAGGAQDGRAGRVADVKLTTDDPAKAPGAARGAAAGGPAPAKWIDVNLTTQTLVAYEGDWPVFSTLVSTGLPRTPTPPGSYRIFTKLVADDMRGGSVAAGDYYFLPQVPYVMYFLEGGYALHGTYWHSNFGSPMSRGCVNLTPQEAKWLYEWAPLGTVVVVHH